MGIDYDGGMVVGEHGHKIDLPENEDSTWEWLVEENEMDAMSQWYDAGEEYMIFGFPIKDIPVTDIDDEWLENVRKKSQEFEKITGVPARLIGTQDIS